MAEHSNIRPGLGLSLPDRDFFSAEELTLARSINPTIYLAMMYDADKGAAEQVNYLVRIAGHEDVLARIQVDRVVDEDAGNCAVTAYDRAGRLQAKRVHVVMGNELNYVGEGYRGDLDVVMSWLRSFALNFRALDGDRAYKLHIPAPWSGDVGEDNEQARIYWRKCKEYDLGELFDIADVHGYADGYGIFADCIDILSMETWVTEHNRCMQAAADSTRSDASPRVECAIYFIETWENYDPGPMGTPRPGDEFSLTLHPELLDAFVAANESVNQPSIIIDPIDLPEEKPMPEDATIGSGLLDMMTADGTTPAQTQSTWLPLGKDPAEVEQCYGLNGTLYVWLLNGSGGFRFLPDR